MIHGFNCELPPNKLSGDMGIVKDNLAYLVFPKNALPVEHCRIICDTGTE